MTNHPKPTNGGTGNNTCLFGKGDSQDIIQSVYDTTPGKLNTLRLKAGVTPSEVTLKNITESGYLSLEVSITGTADKIIVRHFFYSGTPANASPFNAIVSGVPGNPAAFRNATRSPNSPALATS